LFIVIRKPTNHQSRITNHQSPITNHQKNRLEWMR